MYIVWFNMKYKRQFEAVVPKEDWDECRRKHGTAGAVVHLIIGQHRVKNKNKVTKRSQRSVQAFVTGSIVRPDTYGPAWFKVGKSKRAVLEMGHSELLVVSTRGAIHVHKKRRRSLFPR